MKKNIATYATLPHKYKQNIVFPTEIIFLNNSHNNNLGQKKFLLLLNIWRWIVHLSSKKKPVSTDRWEFYYLYKKMKIMSLNMSFHIMT